MRRLQNHILQDANGLKILNGTYTYDFAGNITKIENTGETTDPGFGGDYTLNYEYDTLNRLLKSSGNALPHIREGQPPTPIVSNITSMFNTSLSYNVGGGIATKTQYHEKDGAVQHSNTYDNTYSYISGTHMVERIVDGPTGAEDYYKYDGNGNAIEHSTIQTGPTNLYWDEQDRLRAVHTPEIGSFQYYVYDDKGERTIKADVQNDTELYQNGEMVNNGSIFNNFKVYPNPYVVYSGDGMLTKHYFAGDQRIASRLVDVGTTFISTTTTKQSTSDGNNKVADPKEAADNGFKNFLSKAGYNAEDVEKEFSRNTLNTLNTNDAVYYLHGDHLSTATFVTNEVGEATQFFLNLPFGETMVEQQEPTSYVNPYKFNAKELDNETGLYYYGARYYDPRTSIWYGVDPLAIYNPVMETQFYGDGQHNGGIYNYGNLNPYVYCYQNPIVFIDPNGKQSYFMNSRGFYIDGDSSWGQYAGSVKPNDDYHELTRINGNLYHKNTDNWVGRNVNRLFGTGFDEKLRYDVDHEIDMGTLQEFGAMVVTGMALGKVGGVAGALLKKAGGSLWGMAPLERGFVYETILGLKGAFKSSNFPVIDAFADGVATSIKTLDLAAKSYAKNNQVFNTLKGYINKLANFKGAEWGGEAVEGSAIKSRVLEVGVPEGATSSQIEQINKAIKYGKDNGVKVNVRVVK
ncbi:hypothetical protein HX13_17680 [Chryseobacterium sp. P1-3]|uniref:endonuclease toxin domain-containing protein n=1 Tax=Chryseobacterium sp. (strain P1-3) TaxID=1517683 RepID=UPI0004E6B6B6|nr:RHS repeat-associated core domain-containing protein [Chryseobacterium sp. P1-3]KFF73830.1 hypothetical protein HX13_17680 [Chryseobacterium sp. P1-3]